jgi:hypothetical protein
VRGRRRERTKENDEEGEGSAMDGERESVEDNENVYTTTQHWNEMK